MCPLAQLQMPAVEAVFPALAYEPKTNAKNIHVNTCYHEHHGEQQENMIFSQKSAKLRKP
jgi:hypothetical protein